MSGERRRLNVAPITIGEARDFVRVNHSHLGAPVSALFALSVCDGDRVCCVAIVGRPVARMLQDGETCEVIRLCSDETEHAASMALAAAVRAAVALGWKRIVSSTLLGEPGTCYRAAGWAPVALGAESGTARWSAHPRHTAGSHAQPGRKVRWEAGPMGGPRDPEVDAAVRAAVGTIEIPDRPSNTPLFDTKEDA